MSEPQPFFGGWDDYEVLKPLNLTVSDNDPGEGGSVVITGDNKIDFLYCVSSKTGSFSEGTAYSEGLSKV